MLTQKLLKELLHYDPNTGIFTWRVRDRRHFKSDRDRKIWVANNAGKKAGNKGAQGYLRVCIFKKSYKSHRLAFLYMTGSFPPEQTDHINGIRSDNRWVNLRPVDSAENQKNTKRRVDNISGVTGVSWAKRDDKWQAWINSGGTRKHFGYFTDKFEAICARKSAERRYGFHINHGRNPAEAQQFFNEVAL